MRKEAKIIYMLLVIILALVFSSGLTEGISYYQATEDCYKSGGFISSYLMECGSYGTTCLKRYSNDGPCGVAGGGDASLLWEIESCDAERYSCPAYLLCCRCKNDCNTGQKSCGEGNLANFTRTCGNYDQDSCLEWSNYAACPKNYLCQGGVCVTEATSTAPLTPIFYISITQTFYDMVRDALGRKYRPVGIERDYADLPSKVVAGTYVEIGFKTDRPEFRDSCINVSANNLDKETSITFNICGLKEGWWSIPLTVNSQARMNFKPFGVYNVPSDFVLNNRDFSIDIEWTKTITQNTKLLNDIFLQEDGLIINQSGIELDCQGHKIVGSRIGYGILVNGKRGVTIKNCFISNFSEGIAVLSSYNLNIIGNQLEKNTNYGIRLDFSEENEISGNEIYDNRKGVYLVASKNNVFTHNFITDNTAAGIDVMGSIDNTFYDNFFENSFNVWDNGINNWNKTLTSGMSIVGGPYTGGNYWSDYKGQDNTGDKIGDTELPYNSNKNIMNSEGDLLPLVYVSGRAPDCGPAHLSLCDTKEECENKEFYWWNGACHLEKEGEKGDCRVIGGKSYWVTDSSSQLSENNCKKYGKTCCLFGQTCVQIFGQWECAALGGRCSHYITKEECSGFTKGFAENTINDMQGGNFCVSSNENGKVSCFCYWNEFSGKCEASWNRVNEQNQVVEECNYFSSESLCDKGFKKIVYTSTNPESCGRAYEKIISCVAGRDKSSLYIIFSVLSALTAAIVFYFEKQPVIELLAKLKEKIVKS